MSSIVKVRLTKLFLWVEASRFQAWPELMAKLDPNRVYSGTSELAKSVLGYRIDEGGNVKYDDFVLNLPSWGEPRKGAPVLKGIGLVEKRNHGYAISDAGKRLGKLYCSESVSYEWKRELALLLLMREPRTRIIVDLLAKLDSFLQFAQPKWFGGSRAKAIIESSGRRFYPFPPRGSGETEMHRIIQDRAKWALGVWAEDEPLKGAEKIELAGVETDQFSLQDLGTFMRCAFELFLNLDLVQESAGVVTWNHSHASDVLPKEVLADFGGPVLKREPPEDTVMRLIETSTGDSGFLVASELRNRCREAGIDSPDRQIDSMIAEGLLTIAAHDYGQAIHGEGLFGDQRKQLVNFRINRSNSQR